MTIQKDSWLSHLCSSTGSDVESVFKKKQSVSWQPKKIAGFPICVYQQDQMLSPYFKKTICIMTTQKDS